MENVLLEKQGHVSIITINRPKALNALATAVLEDLESVIKTVEEDKNTYAAIITGAGDKSFVAGADIVEMKDKSVKEAEEYSAFGNKIFRAIEQLHCPVIAAVNGFALGGGCELSLSCDIRIASENAVFGQPEVGLGITPGFGGTQRLARTVGVGFAKELIYTARNIKADKALAIGLVNQVVPAEDLMATALKMANGIAKNAPIAVSQSKKAINNGLQMDIDAGLNEEIKDFAECFASEDQTYGMECFVNRVKEKEFKNK